MNERTGVDPAYRAAEWAARDAYGRLVARLAAQWRDLQAAEDAVGDALVAALQAWPTQGVPDAPEAWLLAAARRRLLHAHRHARVRRAHALLHALDDEAGGDAVQPPDAPLADDPRLALMYVCAHPAIDASMHAALMLQAVLGLDVAAIARVFLLPPATLAQRLVRTKRRIRDAGIGFEIPAAHQLASRTQAVFEAIYAAYALGSESVAPGEAGPLSPLREDAVHLGRIVQAARPRDPEAMGLLALMLFCESRAAARFDARGAFVPLHEQDTARWDRACVREAEDLLMRAAAVRVPGAFQIEAAIQSAHAQRMATGVVPWRAIATLYDHLIGLAPTLGARVAAAAAHGEAFGADAGLARLDALDDTRLRGYLPYWAARAALCAGAGLTAEANTAYARAAGLATVPAVRAFLLGKIEALPDTAMR